MWGGEIVMRNLVRAPLLPSKDLKKKKKKKRRHNSCAIELDVHIMVPDMCLRTAVSGHTLTSGIVWRASRIGRECECGPRAC